MASRRPWLPRLPRRLAVFNFDNGNGSLSATGSSWGCDPPSDAGPGWSFVATASGAARESGPECDPVGCSASVTLLPRSMGLVAPTPTLGLAEPRALHKNGRSP